MKNKYVIGNIYWFKNTLAGKNSQSCGVLKGWDNEGRAIMHSKRWGYISVTLKNLEEHN